MNDYEKNKTCCFIGHRKISITDRLKNELYDITKDLIVSNGLIISYSEVKVNLMICV